MRPHSPARRIPGLWEVRDDGLTVAVVLLWALGREAHQCGGEGGNREAYGVRPQGVQDPARSARAYERASALSDDGVT